MYSYSTLIALEVFNDKEREKTINCLIYNIIAKLFFSESANCDDWIPLGVRAILCCINYKQYKPIWYCTIYSAITELQLSLERRRMDIIINNN